MPRPDPDSPEKIAERARVAEHYARTGSKVETAKQLNIDINKVKRLLDKHKLDVAMGRVPTVLPTIPATPRLPETTEAYMRQAAPRLPEPAPEAGGPVLPDPVPLDYSPFRIDTPGWWLNLSDLHLPYHDKATIELAVAEGREKNAAGVLLNGDVFDCYQLSHHYKEPDKGRFKDELDCGRAFFAYLRSKFPRGRLIFKLGNHDERLRRYFAERAPALFDVTECDLPALAHCDKYGVEVVGDKRVIELGKLTVVHGHEFARGGGVMPARWLFLRGGATALCGHFHQQSQYTFRTLDRREISVWSTGCACFLSPAWLPNNQWSHGYAMVEVQADGWFSVHNRRVLNGRVV